MRARIGFRSILVLLVIAPLLVSPARAQEGVPELARAARVEDPRSVGVGRVIPDLELVPIRGDKRSLSALLKDRSAVVICVTGATCPVSLEYSPRLAMMERAWSRRGVAFVYLNAVEAETLPEMSAQVQRHRLEGLYIADREKSLCRALGVRTTTETFVIDGSRTLVYRGAVDDQYGIGISLDAPKNNYVAGALEAVVAGAQPRIRATWSPGCLVSCEQPAADPGPSTYSGRIAWIIAENCVSCHRPGGAAPFALDSYEAVNGRAKMIEAVARDGLMPPWHGATHPPGGASPWVNDRSLPKADRDALLAWLASDRPRGPEAPLPQSPPLSRTWTIGEPDLLVTSSGLRLPAQGGLLHSRVMVGFTPTEDRWVSAIEFRPVEMGSAHHALVWILAPGDVLPEPNEMPTRLELLGTYSPGDNVIRYPTGVARRVRAGSVFLIDLYAKPMGKEVISAIRIALRWAAAGSEPTWRVRSISAGATRLRAGVGDRTTSTVGLSLPADARVLALLPYMRSQGRSFTVDASGTGATIDRILDAPRYDFRWRVRYEFMEPREFPGRRLTLSGTYVQSAEGGDTPIQVGANAESEALILSVEVLEPNPTRK